MSTGLEPGMRVLEIGPGTGTYTLAAARRVGEKAYVVSIDIEPKMLQRVSARIRAEGIENTHPSGASAHHLPFRDEFF